MAVPQRRTSKMRKNKRRAHDAMTPKSPSVCTHCSQRKVPHRICSHCGYYNGRRIIVTA